MTPAEIAKKLTPAQVRALRNITPNWPPTLVGIPLGSVKALAARGLCAACLPDRPDWRYEITPLGRAVLAEIEKDAAP
jgi:hypothetical protein